MKKTRRILLILLVIGAIGLAVTMGVVIGTGTLWSYEATKEYAIEGIFDTVVLNTVNAQVTAVPADSGYKINAYAKAWLTDEIDMDDVLDAHVEDGVLIISETPFESSFFGIFTQPYELKLTIYVPQAVYEHMGGEQ